MVSGTLLWQYFDTNEDVIPIFLRARFIYANSSNNYISAPTISLDVVSLRITPRERELSHVCQNIPCLLVYMILRTLTFTRTALPAVRRRMGEARSIGGKEQLPRLSIIHAGIKTRVHDMPMPCVSFRIKYVKAVRTDVRLSWTDGRWSEHINTVSR